MKNIIAALLLLSALAFSSYAIISDTALIGQFPGAGPREVLNERLIQDETDFPAPSGGKIQLENKHYIVDGIVSHSNTLVFPTAGGCKLSSVLLGGVSFLNYTNTGNQFEGTLGPTAIVVLDGFECLAGSGTFMDVTGTGTPTGGLIGILNSNILGGASCGTLVNTNITMNSSLFANMGDGLQIINGDLISLINTSFSVWQNNVVTMLDFEGSISIIEIINSKFDPESNESVLFFNPTLTLANEAIITGSSFVQNPFAAGSLDKTDPSLKFTGNAGIEDSMIIGTMFMNGNTFYTHVSDTGSDGAITAFADAGGGSVTATSASHGLSNGDEVCIIDTVNYDGSYIIGNVTAGTFDFLDNFVATETGNWEYGWIIIVGATATDVIERCSLADNKLTFSNRTKSLTSVSFTLNAVQDVASNKTYQFAVFKNACRLPIAKNEVELATNVKSVSLHAASEVEANDVFEIRVRNMDDTQNVLISNVQLVIQ